MTEHAALRWLEELDALGWHVELRCRNAGWKVWVMDGGRSSGKHKRLVDAICELRSEVEPGWTPP